MAATPMPDCTGADPWHDSQPHCRVYSEAPRFRSLLEEIVSGQVCLLDAEPAGEREAVLVDCRHSGDALTLARHRFPSRPLVGVVALPEAGRMVEVLARGADGVIALVDPPASWRECLHVVLGGGRWLGGPGVEVSLEQKHARHDIARGECHDGDVTRRTQLFVKSRVGEKIVP